ncbi:hypothetical protein PII47_01275 [Pseudomonas sp. 21TX0197]|uniref:hypothetical protein n=1 Tax=unclassified Pseudomonas TaxID=196821 RepID=UPI00091147D2|nr:MULTISPECIES: hypothetical protein [unclassified Pseudomonas]MDB6441991.1 hypothetical protein [Pseudomonas sp. 21TX0197]ROO41816.1 hypothetical protein BIV08_13195 [Pseudomonas sp. AF76]ROO41900.1 hypothetical protein BIV09_05230 [Pseudomonas sp. 7SR1]SFX36239.1 hypothetical protein SAMN03159390_01114 [Pseudomonas sp. NFACC49-2]SFX39161.1 hypothetical protein SAMN03159309_01381 [Pseudomonas sp. NFACC36]
MKDVTWSSVLIVCVCLFAGCAPYQKSRVLEADERLLTYSTRTDRSGKNTEVLCPEPSPDALKTLAGSLSLEKEDVAALAAAFQESGASIGLRTHSIQLLRDQLYSICQAYGNSGITPSAYRMMLTRNQRNTVALMAIEQLTGVVRSPSVTLSGSATADRAGTVLELTTQLNAANAKYKGMDPTTDGAKQLKASIDSIEAALKEARKSLVTASGSSASTLASTSEISKDVMQVVAASVEKIAGSVIGVDDQFYLCLDLYESIGEDKVPTVLKDRCSAVFARDLGDSVKSLGQQSQQSGQLARPGEGGRVDTPPPTLGMNSRVARTVTLPSGAQLFLYDDHSMAVMKKLEPGKPLGKELAVDPKGLQKAIEDLRRGEM